MHREVARGCKPVIESEQVREAIVERAAATREGVVERMRQASAAHLGRARDGGLAVEDIASDGLGAASCG